MQQAGGNQAAVAYISTSMTFTTFIAVVLYHMYMQINKSHIWSVICCKEDNQYQDNEWNGPRDSGDSHWLLQLHLLCFMEIVFSFMDLFPMHSNMYSKTITHQHKQ